MPLTSLRPASLRPGRRGRTADQQRRAEIAGEASAAAAVADVRPDAPAISDPTVAAFFDLDGTLMIGASIYHFARGLAKRQFFTGHDLFLFAWQQAVFRFGGTENSGHMHRIREAGLGFIAGHRVTEVSTLGEEIYDELMAERIWSGTRAIAEHHLEQGERVWLVTASPVELARIVARRLGLTGALGTVAETIDGVYTGRLYGEVLHGEAKAVAIRALAEREGLDLTRCSAYSDSANDIPMLSLVGHPVAVNPDPELRKEAKANGWEIRDFRRARKTAKIAIPTAAGAGALAGAVSATIAIRRRRLSRA